MKRMRPLNEPGFFRQWRKGIIRTYPSHCVYTSAQVSLSNSSVVSGRIRSSLLWSKTASGYLVWIANAISGIYTPLEMPQSTSR